MSSIDTLYYSIKIINEIYYLKYEDYIYRKFNDIVEFMDFLDKMEKMDLIKSKDENIYVNKKNKKFEIMNKYIQNEYLDTEREIIELIINKSIENKNTKNFKKILNDLDKFKKGKVKELDLNCLLS